MSEQKPSLESIEKPAKEAEELTPEEASAVEGGRKAGTGQEEYYQVTLSDVLISSY